MRRTERDVEAFEDGVAIGYQKGHKEGLEEAIEVIARWLEEHENGNTEFYPPPWADAACLVRSGEPWSSK